MTDHAIDAARLQNPLDERSKFLNRGTRFLVVLVWPLIWVGGLVTTYDAGMSVPDWPGTYGYNLFLYPYESWFFGPFDLFIEHGHRLLAAFVGLVAIFVFGASLRREPRSWVRWLCGGVLTMVIAQGLLGGLRVVFSERLLAMVHGCFGQAFFGLCVFAAIVTGRWWLGQQRDPRPQSDSETGVWGSGRTSFVQADSAETSKCPGPSTANASTAAEPSKPRSRPGRTWWALAVFAVLLAYMQVVLGAVLRHGSPSTTPGAFAHTVALHVAGAITLWLLSLGLAARGFFHRRSDLAWPGYALAGIVTLQTLLGTGTWVVHYGFPELLSWVPGSESFIVDAKGFIDSIIVTAHVAMGALILGLALALAVRITVVRRRGGDLTIGRGRFEVDNLATTDTLT
ncbi:MAG: COX15/CtaA family protein [Planctomycetota bacterium]